MSLLPFGIAGAAEHRDVPGIGFRNIVAARSATNPIVPSSSVIVGNGLSQTQPQDIPPLPCNFAYPVQLQESKETVTNTQATSQILMRIARWAHQCRVDQTKETHAFTCADELLGDLKTHQAAKRMSRKKIGAAWLSSPNFKDVIGSHRFDRARDVMRSVQRRRLQTERGPIAPQSAEQMSVIHHETISVVHEEKRLTFAGRAAVAGVVSTMTAQVGTYDTSLNWVGDDNTYGRFTFGDYLFGLRLRGQI